MNLDICAVSQTKVLGFLSFSSSVLVDNKHNISVILERLFFLLVLLGFFTTQKIKSSYYCFSFYFTWLSYNYLENMYS